MNGTTTNLNAFKPFNEETLEDALVPIRERFGEGACELARKHLRNPLQKQCNNLGTVGYRKGKPVCFQVACIRRLYWKQQEIFGIVGGLTCRTFKGCPPSVTFETIERAETPRLGSVIGFGNSCCVETATIDEEKGGHLGPASCAAMRMGIVNPIYAAYYFMRRKIFKLDVPRWKSFNGLEKLHYERHVRGMSFRRIVWDEHKFFDGVMEKYLQSNNGLVSSRYAEEVDWMFGDRIRSGKCVVIGAFKGDDPLGYGIVEYEDETAKRWKLIDLIAIGNDAKLLSLILKETRRYLRLQTPAMIWSVTQFSTYTQSILSRYFPREIKSSLNRCSWSIRDCELRQEIENSIDTDSSWFFTPYDGDLAFF